MYHATLCFRLKQFLVSCIVQCDRLQITFPSPAVVSVLHVLGRPWLDKPISFVFRPTILSATKHNIAIILKVSIKNHIFLTLQNFRSAAFSNFLTIRSKLTPDLLMNGILSSVDDIFIVFTKIAYNLDDDLAVYSYTR